MIRITFVLHFFLPCSLLRDVQRFLLKFKNFVVFCLFFMKIFPNGRLFAKKFLKEVKRFILGFVLILGPAP